MTITKAIARAWTDPDYRARLMTDPHAALTEAGVAIPAGATIKVTEDTADTRHIVLPVAPGNVNNLSSEELEKVAGGYRYDTLPPLPSSE